MRGVQESFAWRWHNVWSRIGLTCSIMLTYVSGERECRKLRISFPSSTWDKYHPRLCTKYNLNAGILLFVSSVFFLSSRHSGSHKWYIPFREGSSYILGGMGSTGKKQKFLVVTTEGPSDSLSETSGKMCVGARGSTLNRLDYCFTGSDFRLQGFATHYSTRTDTNAFQE